MHIMTKEQEYAKAMDTYHRNPLYNKLALVVSAVVVFLQAVTLTGIEWDMPPVAYALCLVVTYLVTDFINGLVHMFMDNNNNYTSIIGPLIAVFHLHHKHPLYKDRHPAMIYILESGSKNWLVVYLSLVIFAQNYSAMAPSLNFTLVMVGVLSSFAEVSHYLCHNSFSPAVQFLQRWGVLLRPGHHARHHEADNVNYAFLNGVTDPLLNAIAHRTCNGYMTRSDLHVKSYTGGQSSNRA